MKMKMWFALFLTSSYQIITSSGQVPYKVAVVEYAPADSVYENIRQATYYMSVAGSQGANLFIFPEMALARFGNPEDVWVDVPPSSEGVTPCDYPDRYSNMLVAISCQARRSRLYTVINVPEGVDCQGGPNDLNNCATRYNTDVAFDKNGMIVACYRKTHLFGEEGFSSPETAQYAILHTEFGDFGMITCFDMLFDKPAQDLVNNHGIRDFIFPTAWFSERPFLTALQMQSMWSHVNDVRVHAACYSHPAMGSTGSGIHAGKQGALATFITGVPTTKLLIAEIGGESIPTSQNQISQNTESVLLQPDDMAQYMTRKLMSRDYFELRCGGISCRFDVEIDEDRENAGYQYIAACFDGVRDYYGFATGGVQVCAVIGCSDNSLENCGVPRISQRHTFKKLRVTATTSPNALSMPSTLLQTLQPLSPRDFSHSKSCDYSQCQVDMNLNGALANLLTFGHYCRVFERDNTTVAKGSNPNSNIPIPPSNRASPTGESELKMTIADIIRAIYKIYTEHT